MHASGRHARILTGLAGNSPITRWIMSLIASQRISYLTRLSKLLIKGTVPLYRSSTILWCSSVASHSRGVLDAISYGIYVVRLLELVTFRTCEWGPSIPICTLLACISFLRAVLHYCK